MTSTTQKQPLNGVDTPTLFATLDAVKGQPDIADFRFRATNEWVSGTHSRTSFSGFYGAGQEMELVKGHRDPSTGVEMREVGQESAGETRTVTLSIPKTSMNHPDTIEEVVVIGRRPEKPEPLDISYEWLDDYDNDSYGLVIRFGKDTKWPIRLYLDSSPGYVR